MAKVIKIEKETSPHNDTYFAVIIKCQDGINIKTALAALVEWKDKAKGKNTSHLEKAFVGNNVQIRLKAYGSYIPGGNIKKDYFEAFMKLYPNN